MRLNFGSRLLVALTGLLVLFAGISAFIFGVDIFPFQINSFFLEGPRNIEERLVLIGVGLLLCGLGIHSFLMLFRSGKDRGFILQHTEYGDVNISVKALENMVHQSIDSQENLKITHTKLRRTRKGIVVDLKISLSAGMSIPTIVSTLQKKVKEYIALCSGVEVKEVRVMVDLTNKTLTSFDEGAITLQQSSKANDPLPQGNGHVFEKEEADPPEEKEVFHQRILRDAESSESAAFSDEAAVHTSDDEPDRHQWSKPEFVQDEPETETDAPHENDEEDA